MPPDNSTFPDLHMRELNPVALDILQYTAGNAESIITYLSLSTLLFGKEHYIIL